MTQTLFNNNQTDIPLVSNDYLKLKLKEVDIFNDKESYLNSIRLFYAYFDKVPSLKCLSNVDCLKVQKWMKTQMIENIIHTHASEKQYKPDSEKTSKIIIYLLRDELLLTLDKDIAEVVYASGNDHLAQELIDILKGFTKREKRTTDINMIVSGNYFLSTYPAKIKKPVLNIDTHYNDDLYPLHCKILNSLKKKSTKGLFLFHGAPGTGKSTYIRYLIHHLKKR